MSPEPGRSLYEIFDLLVDTDPIALRDAAFRLVRALEGVVAVEPFSGTPRLDVTDWANALDKAQAIARNALDEEARRAP